MRRLFVVCSLLAVTLTAVAAAPASAASKRKLNATVNGSVLGTDQEEGMAVSVFLLRSSALGEGAGKLGLRGSTSGPSSAEAVVFLGNGTLSFELAITLGQASGDTIPLTGEGRITGGTGKYKRAKGAITLTGTQAGARYDAKIKGTLTY